MHTKKVFSKIVTISFLLLVGFISACHLMTDLSEINDNNSPETNASESVEISSISLGKSSLSLSVGDMEYLSVKVYPQSAQSKVNLNWSYDTNIIECDTSNFGITIKGLNEGQTALRCSYAGYDATCIISVTGYAEGYESSSIEPYIYSNTTVLQTSPGVTEKVFVSLYGGNAGDLDGYTWTVDNQSVCNIQPTGQYCLITAKDSGYARIKVTHSKSSYPYYMGVYVFNDSTKIPYITTSENILTMKQDDGESTITVSLKNPLETSSEQSFNWEITNQDSENCPVRISSTGNKAVVTPSQSGSCTIRVTHPDAPYPLEILCRVIKIVKNVYIQPDTSVVYLNGDAEQTVTCTLENLESGTDENQTQYQYMIDNYTAAEIVASAGNKVIVKGVGNGSAKLIITHPASTYAREVLLVITGQINNAIDASVYITTNQNYIRTKVGSDTIPLSISLKGGKDGDEKDFVWQVNSSSDSGSGDVIKLETTNGTAVYARAATSEYAYGKAYITPLKEGTATITLTHPKILYPTEILVKVLNKDAILEEPLYFSGDGLLRILNGEKKEYTVELKGANKVASDERNIKWSIDDNRLQLNANENIAEITAPSKGTGQTISHIQIEHNKVDAPKQVLVMTADTEEELLSMKALYSDKLYYNLEVDSSTSCFVEAVGFTSEADADGNYQAYDFSRIRWTTGDVGIATVERTKDNPLIAVVKGVKSGSTKVTAELEGVKCDFTITVYPKGSIHLAPEIYFTTSQNVVSLSSAGKTQSVSVTAVNLPSYEYGNISWQSSDETVATVQANGNRATITATGQGESVITVSHTESQNSLKIYVRVGSEYVLPESEPVVFISAQDVLTMLKDSQPVKLQATLTNFNGADSQGFSFKIDNENIAQISSQSVNGVAYIKPVSAGQAEITISHSASDITKKVLVVVGNSLEELQAFQYLTTSNNVVAIGEGNTKNISVSVQNAPSPVLDGYTWTSSAPEIVDVVSSGSTAVFTGNKIGTAIITVQNRYCNYPLQIIAQCVDPIVASANPYIQLNSSVLTVQVSSEYTSVKADLVGGKESDYSNFVWTSSDSSVCTVYGQNEVGKIRTLKEGQAYITVSHPKAAYSARILIVCDNPSQKNCYISVPSSVISMKPTDSGQTVTASLINGDATDKYNFTWSLDVYDIVDFQYSANVCTIKPKQSGTATITVSHPKAAYDQQIIVNVQQYSSFGFPNESMTIEQGSVKFLTMQVPVTNITTHIEYSVENSNICTISGTKTTAQIQAVQTGTTTVHAKLIATSTGAVQSSADMMIYVKEKATTAVYITAGTTVYTVNKGKSQSLSATLTGTGVTASDQYNLKWSTSDSDIVQVTGIGSDGTIKGSSIYITALKSGEAIITCSHEKAASTLQFYVVVPGEKGKTISLDKTYVVLTKGTTSGTQVKASIQNAESSSDYQNIIWSIEGTNGEQIARLMGSGQTVIIFPVKAGNATVYAHLPGAEKEATCSVLVKDANTFQFEKNAVKVMPFHSTEVKYKVSPPDATLNWTISSQDDFFTYTDNGCDAEGNGTVTITGLKEDTDKEGIGTLTCVTNGNAKGSISIRVTWEAKFEITRTSVSSEPTSTVDFAYTVNPPDALVTVEDPSRLCAKIDVIKDGPESGSGKIVLTPQSGGTGYITVTATNPNNTKKPVIQSYQVKCDFRPRVLTTKTTLSSKVATQTGASSQFSSLEGDTLNIGDGETVTITIANTTAKTDADFTVKPSLSGGLTATVISKNSKEVVLKISHPTDTTRDGYRIIKGYRPTYNGSTQYPGGGTIGLSDFTWSFFLRDGYIGVVTHIKWGMTVYSTVLGNTVLEYNAGDQNIGSFSEYNPHWDMNPSFTVSQMQFYNGWGRTRDTSLDGKCYTVSDFQKSPWFYIPQKSTSWAVNQGIGGTLNHKTAEINSLGIGEAIYESTTSDKTVKSQTSAGSITIQAQGAVNSTTITINCFVQTRDCSCTQK